MSVHSLELSVRSLLFREPVGGLDDVLHDPDAVLVEPLEQPELAAQVWRARRALQPGWSEGVVLIGYGGTPLIDLTMYDQVWPLWSCLVAMVAEYLDSGEDGLAAGRGEFSFPTQQVEVALYDASGGTWFLVGDTQVDVHRGSFVAQLLAGAAEFFEWVSEWTDDDVDWELEQIAALLQRVPRG